jgi:hypothetical protein
MVQEQGATSHAESDEENETDKTDILAKSELLLLHTAFPSPFIEIGTMSKNRPSLWLESYSLGARWKALTPRCTGANMQPSFASNTHTTT